MTWSPKYICVYVVLINVVTCYLFVPAECEFTLPMFRSIYISAVISISVKQIDIQFDSRWPSMLNIDDALFL